MPAGKMLQTKPVRGVSLPIHFGPRPAISSRVAPESAPQACARPTTDLIYRVFDMPLHRVGKFKLLRLAVIVSCTLVCLDSLQAHAQFDQLSGKGSASHGSLRGRVVMSNGQKPPNVRIELRNGTGLTVSSVWVDTSGSFEIGNLERGSYEVIATWGKERTATEIEIFSFDTPLTIRIDSGSPTAPGQAVVSVNALRAHCREAKAFETADRLLQRGDPRGAWNQINKTLQACPNFVPALTLRGVLKMYSNKLQEAVSDFDAALKLDRSYSLAYIGLASDYNLMRRFDEALRVLDQASSQTAPSWQAQFEASKALLGKGSFDRALESANHAANMLGHDFAMLNLVKAYAYLGLKDKISAGTELRCYLRQKISGEHASQVRALLAEIEK